jgi:hypothetical protein
MGFSTGSLKPIKIFEGSLLSLNYTPEERKKKSSYKDSK